MVQIDNALLKQSVDPNVVPKITLNDGSKIPSIGYGTFGSDPVSYTHLDVYKRQRLHCWMEVRWNPILPPMLPSLLRKI